jgi:hypothetical protein
LHDIAKYLAALRAFVVELMVVVILIIELIYFFKGHSPSPVV